MTTLMLYGARLGLNRSATVKSSALTPIIFSGMDRNLLTERTDHCQWLAAIRIDDHEYVSKILDTSTRLEREKFLHGNLENNVQMNPRSLKPGSSVRSYWLSSLDLLKYFR